ncbi:MAG: hypothetical protein RJB39_5 [Candidatus Parcubacteria bacterium]|jgi:uncharacterized protein (UPF0333 family)
MNTKKGSTEIALLIIIVLAIGLAGGYFLSKNDKVTEYTTDTTTIVSATTAPAGYQNYSNQTVGFSTIISNKGRVGDMKTDTVNWSFYESENPQFVYVYGPDAKTNIKSRIVVWQEENGACLPKLIVENRPNVIEPRQNKANLTILQRNWGDAAMGQYEDLSIYSVSNGKKQYCIVGQVHGSWPYNLEGKAYEDQEKVNASAIIEFTNVLQVFVDDFKFI